MLYWMSTYCCHCCWSIVVDRLDSVYLFFDYLPLTRHPSLSMWLYTAALTYYHWLCHRWRKHSCCRCFCSIFQLYLYVKNWLIWHCWRWIWTVGHSVPVSSSDSPVTCWWCVSLLRSINQSIDSLDKWLVLFSKMLLSCYPKIYCSLEISNVPLHVCVDICRGFEAEEKKASVLLSTAVYGDVTIIVYHARSAFGGKVQGKVCTFMRLCTLSYICWKFIWIQVTVNIVVIFVQGCWCSQSGKTFL